MPRFSKRYNRSNRSKKSLKRSKKSLRRPKKSLRRIRKKKQSKRKQYGGDPGWTRQCNQYSGGYFGAASRPYHCLEAKLSGISGDDGPACLFDYQTELCTPDKNRDRKKQKEEAHREKEELRKNINTIKSDIESMAQNITRLKEKPEQEGPKYVSE